MKKGLCILVILFLGIVCHSQNALAATVTANLMLNVNAANTAGDYIQYASANAAVVNSPLLWKEKALYPNTLSGSANLPIHPSITVKNLVAGDLIVRMDIISDTAGVLTSTPYWLKYGTGAGTFIPSIEMIPSGGTATGDTVAVDPATLSTLALGTSAANQTTILFDFSTSNLTIPNGYIIFTACLVNSVSSTTPQVLGADVQTIFFAPSWINGTVNGQTVNGIIQ